MAKPPSARKLHIQQIVRNANASRANKITESAANAILDGLAESVVQGLKYDGSVVIRGVGTVQIKKQNAIMRVNPKTRDPVHVPAKWSVKFKFLPALKKALNVP